MRPDLLDKGPSGAVGGASPSGWINEELFEKWFDHFLKTVRKICQWYQKPEKTM
jgi:hypothetical protein